MDALANSLKNLCLSKGFEQTYWIGLSGGLDSQVLLHLFYQLRKEFPLKLHAVYINHGLSPNARSWELFCKNSCHTLDVEFSSYALKADSLTESLEAWARDGRYGIFAKLLQKNDVLITAHHQDDQAETVLLQLLRGAGPKGLSAMPKIKSFGAGFHARPLLNFTRDTLQKYAEQHSLQWIEDESNGNVRLMRNFLRHEVLPILKKRLPTVTQTLARVAENCAEAQSLIELASQKDLEFVQNPSGTLTLSKLLNFNPALQRSILRAWFASLKVTLPSSIKLQKIQDSLLKARTDKMPVIKFGKNEIRRFRDELFVFPLRALHDSAKIYKWDLKNSLSLDGVGVLKTHSKVQIGLRPNVQNVSIRFRQGGELLRLPGRNYRHDLKKLFQEWGVPPWERDRIPLLYVQEDLAAVVGYAISADFMTNEAGLNFELIKSGE